MMIDALEKRLSVEAHISLVELMAALICDPRIEDCLFLEAWKEINRLYHEIKSGGRNGKKDS